MKTSMAIRDTIYRREVMEIPRVREGGSQGGRCELGLESKSKQAFRGLRERDFQEDKINRTFYDLKLLGGFTFMIKNFRKQKHTKDRQLLTLGG